jgi:hypothetical protein
LEKIVKILSIITPFCYLSLVSALAVGCGRMDLDVNEYGSVSASKQLVEGTPEAVGVLALLNHPHTSVVMLDESVELDVRAANALVEVRDGEDGRPQTDDDNLFHTIDEVDSVSWVGPAAMSSLQNYVVNYGWVPLGDEPLGTWDNVTFTVDESEAVLELANTASVDSLDNEIRLDSRAVESIVAARPLLTVLELSELWYVGESTLESLKLYAIDGTAEGAFCDPVIEPIEDVRTEEMNDLFVQLDAKTDRLSAFYSYKITGCDEFIGSDELERFVVDEIAESVTIVDVDQAGGFTDGIDSFESLLIYAVGTSTEQQLNGDRTVDGAAELLESEAAQFVRDIKRGPYELFEVWMYGQDDGCREELVAALEVESRRFVVFSVSEGCL